MIITHAVAIQIVTVDSWLWPIEDFFLYFYFISIWLNIINNIPINKYIIVNFLFLKLKDVGNNSYIDIWIIIPAINDNNIPIMLLLIILLKNRYARSAPRGSDKAEKRA